MRSSRPIAKLAVLGVVVGLVVPRAASTAPRDDPRAERARVRSEQAQIASELDVARASKEEVDRAIEALNDNLATEETALARTQARIDEATADIAAAEASIERLGDEIVVLKDELRRRAVQAFVSPPGEDALTVFSSSDFVSASSRKFYVELRSQDDADVADRLDGALNDLDHQRTLATEAREQAEDQRAEQRTRTEAVRAAREQQQVLATKLQSNITDQVAHAIELAKTDRVLSQRIAEEQAALAARLAEIEAAKGAAADAVRNATPASVGADGVESQPSAPASGGGTTVTPGPTEAGIALAYVQGVPVNAAVADQVRAMIDAAAAAGITLQIGNSYRSIPHQIQLRKQNCGTSRYAIYEMPASACTPDTAKPGQSQHQLGLAIDFSTYSFSWLKANAARFGYYNLPSESWHWSTTGG